MYFIAIAWNRSELVNMNDYSSIKKWSGALTVLFLLSVFMTESDLKSQEQAEPYTETVIINKEFYKIIKELSAADPEMKVAEQEIRRSRAMVSYYSRILPENPNLEISLKQGKSVSEAEAGISQKISIAGERSALREKSRAEADLKEHEKKITAFKRTAELRRIWFGLGELKRIQKKLTDQEKALSSLRARLGPTYQDAKFGTYAYTAFGADIAFLKSEIRSLDEQIRMLSLQYKDMTGRDAAEIPENIYYQFVLPDHAEAAVRKTGSLSETNPEIRIHRLKALAERAALKAVSRQYYPSPEIFLFAGEEQNRSSALLGLNEKTSRDTYIRGGIRLPLPVAGGVSDLKEIQSISVMQEDEKAERLARLLEERFRSALETYRSKTELYKEVKYSGERAQAAGSLIQSALLRRTISYSEFWTEQDRYHRILFLQLQLYLDSLDSLSEIEILSGRLFI